MEEDYYSLIGFDWKIYLYNNPDLKIKCSNLKECIDHWILYGKKEGRTSPFELNIPDNLSEEYKDFDWERYMDDQQQKLYDDLKNMKRTKEHAWIHWMSKSYENREEEYEKDKKKFSLKNVENNPEYINFNWQNYVYNYKDIASTCKKKDDAWQHWMKVGKMERRIHLIKIIEQNIKYEEFDWETYLNNYPELKEQITTKADAWGDWRAHWRKYGRVDIRTCYDLSKENDSYLKSVREFLYAYNEKFSSTFKNPKVEFRYFCFRYLNYIRKILLPEIHVDQKYEAVLIEYRKFPHLEFLIRNAIIKLGSGWSYSVICGLNNYDFMIKLCHSISPNVKVIKTNYHDLNQSTYSEFLASVDFWNLFKGEKILIYQEDSCIFGRNIEDFIEWDYIGAPWPKNQNDNEKSVGNGGFSLRTRQIMIDVINKISIHDTIYNKSTTEYMFNSRMRVGPEDVYFSLNMLRYGIGKVADWDSAFQFSSESIYNKDSFGGHNFWLCNPQWKELLYRKVIPQFCPITYDKQMLEHRGGWKSVIEILQKNDFFNNRYSEYIFIDILELKFLWEKNYRCDRKWAGVIHCTQSTPYYLNIVNIRYLFKNQNFIRSLDNCLFIVSLSDYVKQFMDAEFKKLGKKIDIIVMKHPVVFDDDHENNKIPKFDIQKYIDNENKHIIQVGQQLRKMTSIYRLKLDDQFKKLWLTGTKNMEKCEGLLKQEIKFFNIQDLNMNEVEMKYTDTYEEYDELLSKNIVFIDLFDAAANNTIIECIVRNTPIIVNKLPAVIEYLTEDYPLLFDHLNQVNDLLSINNIRKGYEFLKKMDKSELKMEYFKNRIITTSAYHI